MTGGPDSRAHQVAALGATPIDYRTEDFVERIRDLTGDGVDVGIDPVGGARHLWRSSRVLRRGVLAARVPLADAARAHELLEHGRHGGKVVLVTSAYPHDRLRTDHGTHEHA